MSWGWGARLPTRSVSSLRLALIAAVAIGGCSTTQPLGAVATTTATRVTTATTVATTVVTTTTVPPTTVYQATAPQPSRDEAAAHLVAAWRAGDRAAAAADATPAAAAAVLAQPYPEAGVEFRGCSIAAAGPSACVYRVLATGNLLELSVVEGTGGWLTQAARFLG